MRADRYLNYSELAANESKGTDFNVTVLHRESSIAIIAPHGGQIEPRTTEEVT